MSSNSGGGVGGTDSPSHPQTQQQHHQSIPTTTTTTTTTITTSSKAPPIAAGGRGPRDQDQGNQRYSSVIYEGEIFLTKLREFKPQSLGCLEARRKSSSTLIFPNPQQACLGAPKCPRYPHNVKPTPGYWIECHGPGKATPTGTLPPGTMILGHHHNHHHLYTSGSGTTTTYDNLTFDPVQQKLVALSSSGSSQKHAFSTTPTGERILTSRLASSQDNDPISDHSSSGMQDYHRRDSFLAGGLKRGLSAERLVTTLAATSTPAILSANSGGGGSDSTGSSTRDQQHQQQQEQEQQEEQQQQQQQQQENRSIRSRACDGRRKFGNRRTTTRDDMELHRPRRGTPNITITEPSFNQSTVTYDMRLMNRTRQATLMGDDPAACELIGERAGTGDSNQSVTNNDTINTSEPIKFSIQEATGSGLKRQESSDGETELTALLATSSQNLDAQQAADYKSHRQHRPSVIKEDSDMENAAEQAALSSCDSEAASASASGAADRPPTPPNHWSFRRGDLFCSLSSVDYNKITFKQALKVYSENLANYEKKLEKDEKVKLTSAQAQGQVSGPSQGKLHIETKGQGKPASTGLAKRRVELPDPFKGSSLELISFEEENYEKHYFGNEHWNYFTKDDLLGPVMLSLKQEVNNQRDHFHVLLRTVSYTLHGTIPAVTICADRYDREAIVKELSEIANLDPPLMLGQLPSTPDDLLKLDHIFIKTELKVGVIYIKDGQADSEEAILGNKEESELFSEFLDILGDRITLKGFDRYKGGLDTVHNLTGIESVYTWWRNIEIMFHVSTMLPHEDNDPQKLQKKRHIGNDIVCVAFIESDDNLFWPGCIKSYFLHTFIAIRTSPKALKEGEKRKYYVSCVCRNEVQHAFKPYLIEQDEFYKSDYFREWLLVKIVNGERASYSAPKFARMQDRTRSQLLEDIITNLANHLVTGQIPKPYRRGSWRPLGHIRASSPLDDSLKDSFDDTESLAKDFQNAFCGPTKSMLCDVVFRCKDKQGNYRLVHGVRAIMAMRSRTFLEILYGLVIPGEGSINLKETQRNLRAIELKALAGTSGSGGSALAAALSGSGTSSGGAGGNGQAGGSEQTTGGGAKETLSVGMTISHGVPGEKSKSLLTKRGSVGADSTKRMGEKERRQSMLPGLSKSTAQKPTYLTVPQTGSGAGGSAGTSGMIKNAFNRLVSGNWSSWGGNIKGYKGDPIHIKVDQSKTKIDPGNLATTFKELTKIDPDRLAQREFDVKEFDYETFQNLIDYLHHGQCKLSYETIPGLICAAEHYDLPDLFHACFHHANIHMKLSAAPKMMNSLHSWACFYTTASQMLEAIYNFIDPHGQEFLSKPECYDLNESVFAALLSRKTFQVSELKKFQAMDAYARQKITKRLLAKSQKLQKQKSLEQKEQERLLAEIDEKPIASTSPEQMVNQDEFDNEYKITMNRLNTCIRIHLERISNEDLVKIVLPTKVFSNDKVFEVMADESRYDY